MAATGHGATFTFVSNLGTFNGRVTNINVSSPTAEITDMTSVNDAAAVSVLVPTGSWKGGSISVDFVGAYDPQVLVRGYGPLTFSSPGFSVSRQVILESSSSVATTGDAVKGSLKFVMTDYYG